LLCIYHVSKFQLSTCSERWDMVIWVLSVCFWKNFSLAKSRLFWSSQNSHLSVSKIIFFIYKIIKTRTISDNFRILTINFSKNLKKTFKFWVFFAIFSIFEAEARPSALKFLKRRRTLLFVMSVRNFLNNRSRQFLSLKFSHQPISHTTSHFISLITVFSHLISVI
jgi:hypothetical protein